MISRRRPGANVTDRSASESIELVAGGVNDPDGARTAAVLAAYFQAEHTRSARRQVWRAIAITAAVIVVALTTTLLLRSTALTALAALGAAAGWSAFLEWRASERLNELIAKR